MRELRADEIYKEQNRIKINKRYAEDLDYRAKKLEKSKEIAVEEERKKISPK